MLDGAVFVSVTGEIDFATGPVLVNSVLSHDDRKVIFDLSSVDFIDVAGYRALQACADQGSSVSIRHPSQPVRYVLELVDGEDLIEVAPTAKV